MTDETSVVFPDREAVGHTYLVSPLEETVGRRLRLLDLDVLVHHFPLCLFVCFFWGWERRGLYR